MISFLLRPLLFQSFKSLQQAQMGQTQLASNSSSSSSVNSSALWSSNWIDRSKGLLQVCHKGNNAIDTSLVGCLFNILQLPAELHFAKYPPINLQVFFFLVKEPFDVESVNISFIVFDRVFVVCYH